MAIRREAPKGANQSNKGLIVTANHGWFPFEGIGGNHPRTRYPKVGVSHHALERLAHEHATSGAGLDGLASIGLEGWTELYDSEAATIMFELFGGADSPDWSWHCYKLPHQVVGVAVEHVRGELVAMPIIVGPFVHFCPESGKPARTASLGDFNEWARRLSIAELSELGYAFELLRLRFEGRANRS